MQASQLKIKQNKGAVSNKPHWFFRDALEANQEGFFHLFMALKVGERKCHF